MFENSRNSSACLNMSMQFRSRFGDNLKPYLLSNLVGARFEAKISTADKAWLGVLICTCSKGSILSKPDGALDVMLEPGTNTWSAMAR